MRRRDYFTGEQFLNKYLKRLPRLFQKIRNYENNEKTKIVIKLELR